MNTKEAILIATILVPQQAIAGNETFASFQTICSKESLGPYAYCLGYIEGVAEQLLNSDTSCQLYGLEDELKMMSTLSLLFKSRVENADVYEYPKLARQAVEKMLKERYCGK